MDLEILEKIERNTSPKTSTQIVVSENSTKINTTFNPPIELGRTRKYEMALVNLETYYSFPNLSDENNVFRYSPRFPEVGRGDEDNLTRQTQWVEVQISEGSYDFIDLAEATKIAMKQNGHNDEYIKITATTNTLKSVLEFKTTFRLISEREIQFQAFLDFEIRFTKRAFTNRKMLSTS